MSNIHYLKPNRRRPGNNHITTWIAPDGYLVAEVIPRRPAGDFSVQLFADNESCEVTATGATVRAAYTNACHQRRLAQHAIGDLFRQISALKAAVDGYHQRANDAEIAMFKQHAEIAALKRDLIQAQERIRQLEFDANEKDKGLNLVRVAFVEAGIMQGRLDERAKALVKERDEYKRRALIAEDKLKEVPTAQV